jgi:hypothetical protein
VELVQHHYILRLVETKNTRVLQPQKDSIGSCARSQLTLCTKYTETLWITAPPRKKSSQKRQAKKNRHPHGAGLSLHPNQQKKERFDMQIIEESCPNGQRCGKWRTCAKCAAHRQRKTADKAEAMARQHGALFLTVITPWQNQAEEIRRLRASLLRKEVAKAGIWTIETGEQFARLHLNLLTPIPQPCALTGADMHIERIVLSPRAVAAYITKQKGAPDPSQYSGHLVGSWGQIGQFMMTREAPPIIMGAAMNDLLATPDGPRQIHYSGLEIQPAEPRQELTRDQYQALARKHLSTLYAAIERKPSAPVHVR